MRILWLLLCTAAACRALSACEAQEAQPASQQQRRVPAPPAPPYEAKGAKTHPIQGTANATYTAPRNEHTHSAGGGGGGGEPPTLRHIPGHTSCEAEDDKPK